MCLHRRPDPLRNNFAEDPVTEPACLLDSSCRSNIWETRISAEAVLGCQTCMAARCLGMSPLIKSIDGCIVLLQTSKTAPLVSGKPVKRAVAHPRYTCNRAFRSLPGTLDRKDPDIICSRDKTSAELIWHRSTVAYCQHLENFWGSATWTCDHCFPVLVLAWDHSESRKSALAPSHVDLLDPKRLAPLVSMDHAPTYTHTHVQTRKFLFSSA